MLDYKSSLWTSAISQEMIFQNERMSGCSKKIKLNEHKNYCCCFDTMLLTAAFETIAAQIDTMLGCTLHATDMSKCKLSTPWSRDARIPILVPGFDLIMCVLVLWPTLLISWWRKAPQSYWIQKNNQKKNKNKKLWKDLNQSFTRTHQSGTTMKASIIIITITEVKKEKDIIE